MSFPPDQDSPNERDGAVNGLKAADDIPGRPRARRRIEGTSAETGVTVKAYAYADPLPDRIGFGPFYGEGPVSLARRGYIVGNFEFEEILAIIALLEEILDLATTRAAD